MAKRQTLTAPGMIILLAVLGGLIALKTDIDTNVILLFESILLGWYIIKVKKMKFWWMK